MEYKQLILSGGNRFNFPGDVSISERTFCFNNRFKARFEIKKYISFYVNADRDLCFKFFDERGIGRFAVSDSGVYHTRMLRPPKALVEHGLQFGKFNCHREDDGFFVIEGCKIPEETYQKL